jgi:intracellular multiplication protein IcmO
VFDGLAASRGRTATAILLLAAASAAFPLLSPVAVATGACLAWNRRRAASAFPLKRPLWAGGLDPNQPHPVNGKPTADRGIAYLGACEDGAGAWLSGNDLRQHALVLGSDTSASREAMLGIAANALAWGGGFMLVDGLGDVSTFARVHALCQEAGRTKDLLVINFMTGNSAWQAGGGLDPKRLSMRMNPFATGSADILTQLVVSMMDDFGGDGAMWVGRATAMLSGVMRVLCWMRDVGSLELTAAEIRDHMSLRRIVEFADETLFPDIPDACRRCIRSYLGFLPGYQPERKERQSQTTLDHHGYLEMQFTRILGSLADVYGHIFAADGVDIDMHDVVLNRRILVIMLPVLEKSHDEILNLGKIVVSTLKGMMGGTLGSHLEGRWEDVVESRPHNGRTPFVCMFGDCGYYMVSGMALMAAQARSMGFSMVYESQDVASLRRLNDREADSVIANTSTKIFVHREEAVAEMLPSASGVVGSEARGGRGWTAPPPAPGDGRSMIVHGDRTALVRMFVPGAEPPARRIAPNDLVTPAPPGGGDGP